MDRISKALERASQERDREVRPLPVEEAKPISYSRTRRVRVPREVMREGRIISTFSDQRLIDAYRLLRTRVMRRLQQNRWTTLGITSAGPREGKTLTSINLGISIAREVNYSALLVDADLRRPSVHACFGIDPEVGLADFLVNGTPIEDILVNPGIASFVMLPGRRIANGHPEHLSSPRMEQLVQELKGRYPARIVIFDLPPVLIGDDVLGIAPHLDALMLVVEDGRTESDALERSLELLDGLDILGIVLNKSVEEGRSYDYYYSYY